MKRLLQVLFFHATAFAQSPGERMIADYFHNQTHRVPSGKDLQIRRRFLLLGQSLETMQVWDVRAALAALRTLPELKGVPITLEGEGR